MMTGVLQSAAVASLASDSSRPLLDAHLKVSFGQSSSRLYASKGRVFCSNFNVDVQQSNPPPAPAPFGNYQSNPPSSSPPPSPPPPPPPTPSQQPPYQTSPTSYQGWPRPAQSEPPQYQNQSVRYQPAQSQPLLYGNPYRPVFKEPHQPLGYQGGQSQNWTSQYPSQPSQYQSQPQHQSQPFQYQPVQTQPTQYQSQPSQFQNQPSQYHSQPVQYQSQSQPSSLAEKPGYANEPIQSLNQPQAVQGQSTPTQPSGSSSLFQTNTNQSATTPAETSQTSSSLFSSSLSSSSSTTSSFLSSSSYSSNMYGRAAMSNVRRRPYDPEAKMRMKQYRREAMQRQRQQELENLEKNYVLDRDALYKKGDPGTVQGIIRDIITVGYYVKLPDGREGFLPCMQLDKNCPGGIPLLTRLFKVGDEVTVRQEKMYDGGLDKLYAKPEPSISEINL